MDDFLIYSNKFLKPSIFFEGKAIKSMSEFKNAVIFEFSKFSKEIIYGSISKSWKSVVLLGEVVEPLTE